MLKNEHRPNLIKPFPYIGSKYSNGSYQNIINEIPPFTYIIIGFLGACPIAQYFSKKQKQVLAYEMDPVVVNEYAKRDSLITVVNKDFLKSPRLTYQRLMVLPFMYLDPPYLIDSRKGKRPLYKFEMSTAQHRDLLEKLAAYPGLVALSHYENPLYNKYLKGWRKVQWKVQTRNGPAIETLYCNYPKPTSLATYEFLGVDNEDRRRIRRKLSRFNAKLNKLPILEKKAIIQMLTEINHS